MWAWKTNLGDSVKAEIANWATYCNQSNVEYGSAGGLQKNPLAIARTLELAWQAGEKSQALIKLVTDILKFAEQMQK